MPDLDASTLISGTPKKGDVLAGKYRVERVLGSGGMGVVLAATHLDLEETVAIKLLLPHITQAPDAVERFLREARAAIKIRSEHVARVLDVGRLDSGAPYMVMEYLEGRDLAHVVEQHGRLPVATAVDYVLQACEALAQAHARGIVHRDLKPANLFLTERAGGAPFIKVLDFGISKVTGTDPLGANKPREITTTTAILGTPSYMSPEQMRSTRDVDARSDVWSLGAILYALLTGSPPYQGESTADLCAKIIRDPPPRLSDIRRDAPEALSYAIARCLEKAPERRFRTVGELSAAIVEYGSPEARASLTEIMNVLGASASTSKREGVPSVTGPSTPVSDATGPARVVISYPPNKSTGGLETGTGTARAWEETHDARDLPGTTAKRKQRKTAILAILVVGGIEAIVGGAIALQAYRDRAPATPSATAAASSPFAPPTGATMATRSNVEAASTGWETSPGAASVANALPSATPLTSIPVTAWSALPQVPATAQATNAAEPAPSSLAAAIRAAAVGSAPTSTSTPKPPKGQPLFNSRK